MTDEEILLSNLSYTNKDFQTIYPELLDIAKKISLRWDPTQSNESDPGVVLLKLVSIIADKCNYNIDKNILECFPISVTQEPNARELFAQLGYYMPWYRSAVGEVSIAWKNGDSEYNYSLPMFSMVSDEENNVVYTLLEDVVIPGDGTTVSCRAMQGVIQDFMISGESLISVGNLDSHNRVYFTTTNIAENGIFIKNRLYGYSDWRKVNNLELEELGQPVYKFGVSQDGGTCYLEFPKDVASLFGDGVEIKYLSSDGADGNIAANVLTKFFNDPTATYVDSDGVEQTMSITADNTNVTNYSSIRNGCNNESINDAYTNYKRTVGTFDTLVTLRDYNNAIRSSKIDDVNIASNGFVCDRTNDIQCSYKIVSDIDGTEKENICIEKEVKDGINSEKITAFGIKMYLLENVSSSDDIISSGKVVSKGAQFYNKTFEPLENTNDKKDYRVDLMEDTLAEKKSLQHDFLPLLSDKIFMIKNKYPIECKIIPQYKLTDAQMIEVKSNIIKTLYNNLNARKVEFGEKISYDQLYDLILSSDERIKSIMLSDIEYETYAVYFDSADGRFDEIKISDIDVSKTISAYYNQNDGKFYKKYQNGVYSSEASIPSDYIVMNKEDGKCYKRVDTKYERDIGSEFKTEIYAKSVLDGKTQLIGNDNVFEHNLNEKFVKQVDDIKNLTTSAVIKVSSEDGGIASYTLKDNECIKFYAPNLVEKTKYSSYVKYQYCLTSEVPVDTDYMLKRGESITFYWKESDDDSANYKFVKYGEKAIIHPNFTLAKSLSYNESDSTYIGGRYIAYDVAGKSYKYAEGTCTYNDSTIIADIIDNDYILANSKEIAIKDKVEVNIQSPKKCYWILNEKLVDPNDEEQFIYRLFPSKSSKTSGVSDSYILQPGEYFMYVNPQKTAMEVLSAGTKISRHTDGNYLPEMTCQYMGDDNSVLDNGLESVDEYFKDINKYETITLTEMQIKVISPGSTITVSTNRWVTDTSTSNTDGMEVRGTKLEGLGVGPTTELSDGKGISAGLSATNGQYSYNEAFNRTWKWETDTELNEDGEKEEVYINSVSGLEGISYCSPSINLHTYKNEEQTKDAMVGKTPYDFDIVPYDNFVRVEAFTAPDFMPGAIYSYSENSKTYSKVFDKPFDWEKSFRNYFWKKPYHAHNPYYTRNVEWAGDYDIDSSYDDVVPTNDRTPFVTYWEEDRDEKGNEVYTALGTVIGEDSVFPELSIVDEPTHEDKPENGMFVEFVDLSLLDEDAYKRQISENGWASCRYWEKKDGKLTPLDGTTPSWWNEDTNEDIEEGKYFFPKDCKVYSASDFKKPGGWSLYLREYPTSTCTKKFIITYEYAGDGKYDSTDKENKDKIKLVWYKNNAYSSFRQHAIPYNTYHAYNPKYQFNGYAWVPYETGENEVDSSTFIKIAGTDCSPYSCILKPTMANLKCYNIDTGVSFVTKSSVEVTETGGDAGADGGSDGGGETHTELRMKSLSEKEIKALPQVANYTKKADIRVYAFMKKSANFIQDIVNAVKVDYPKYFLIAKDNIVENSDGVDVDIKNFSAAYGSTYFGTNSFSNITSILLNNEKTAGKIVKVLDIKQLYKDGDFIDMLKEIESSGKYIDDVDYYKVVEETVSNDQPTITPTASEKTENLIIKWYVSNEDYSTDNNAVNIQTSATGNSSPEDDGYVKLAAFGEGMFAENTEFNGSEGGSRYFTTKKDYIGKSWKQTVDYKGITLLESKKNVEDRDLTPTIKKIVPKYKSHLYKQYEGNVWLEDYSYSYGAGDKAYSATGENPLESDAAKYTHAYNPSYSYIIEWKQDDSLYAGDAMEILRGNETPEDAHISPIIGQHVINPEYYNNGKWERKSNAPAEYEGKTLEDLQGDTSGKILVFSADTNSAPPISVDSKDPKEAAVEYCVNGADSSSLVWWQRGGNFGRSWTGVKTPIGKSWTSYKTTINRAWTGVYVYDGKSWHSTLSNDLRAWRTEASPIDVEFTNEGFVINYPKTFEHLSDFKITSKLPTSETEEPLPSIMMDDGGWEAYSCLDLFVSNNSPLVLHDNQSLVWYNKEYNESDPKPNTYGVISPNYEWMSAFYPKTYNADEENYSQTLMVDVTNNGFLSSSVLTSTPIKLIATEGLKIYDDYSIWESVPMYVWEQDKAYNNTQGDETDYTTTEEIEENYGIPLKGGIHYYNSSELKSWTSVPTDMYCWEKSSDDINSINVLTNKDLHGAFKFNNIQVNNPQGDIEKGYIATSLTASVLPNPGMRVLTFTKIGSNSERNLGGVEEVAYKYHSVGDTTFVSGDYYKKQGSGSFNDPYLYIPTHLDAQPNDWNPNTYFVLAPMDFDLYNSSSESNYTGVYSKVEKNGSVIYKKISEEPEGWKETKNVDNNPTMDADGNTNVCGMYVKKPEGAEFKANMYYERTTSSADENDQYRYRYTLLPTKPDNWDNADAYFCTFERLYTTVSYNSFSKDLYVVSNLDYGVDGGIKLDVTQQTFDGNTLYMDLYAYEILDYDDEDISYQGDKLIVNLNYEAFEKISESGTPPIFVTNTYYYRDQGKYALLAVQPYDWETNYTDYYIRTAEVDKFVKDENGNIKEFTDEKGEKFYRVVKEIEFNFPNGDYIFPMMNSTSKVKHLKVYGVRNLEDEFSTGNNYGSEVFEPLTEFGSIYGVSDIVDDFYRSRKYYLSPSFSEVYKIFYWDFNAVEYDEDRNIIESSLLPKVCYAKDGTSYIDTSYTTTVPNGSYVMTNGGIYHKNILPDGKNNTSRVTTSELYTDFDERFPSMAKSRRYYFDLNGYPHLGWISEDNTMTKDEEGTPLSVGERSLRSNANPNYGVWVRTLNGADAETDNGAYAETDKEFLVWFNSLDSKKMKKMRLEIDYDSPITSGMLYFDRAYKYNVPDFKVSKNDNFSEESRKNFFDAMLTKVSLLDINQEFNYAHVVDEDVEIKSPLKPESFLDKNHPYNKFTICQLNTYDTDIIITNVR